MGSSRVIVHACTRFVAECTSLTSLDVSLSWNDVEATFVSGSLGQPDSLASLLVSRVFGQICQHLGTALAAMKCECVFCLCYRKATARSFRAVAFLVSPFALWAVSAC